MKESTKNPFSGYRSEVTVENLSEYFVKPEFFEKITSDRLPVIVEGERGTGKTTLLKRLSYEFNFIDFNENKIDYWGIYHKFDKNLVSAFNNINTVDSEKKLFFGHYLTTILTERLIKSLELYKDMFSCAEIESIISIVKDNYFEYNIKINNLNELLEFLSSKKYKTFEFLRNGGKNIKVCNEGVLIQELSNILVSTNFMKDKVIYFLIDECESLMNYQQRVVNTYLKNADKNQTYVLGYKTDGMLDSETADGDYIRMPDDYRKIEILSNINEEDKKIEFSKFVKEICKLRLEKFFVYNNYDISEEGLDIESYLGRFGIEEEIEYVQNKATDTVHQKYKSDFDLISNRTELNWLNDYKDDFDKASIFVKKYILFFIEKKKYVISKNDQSEIIRIFCDGFSKLNSSYYSNYSVSILYLIYKDMRTNRVLGGFDKILSISGGVVRYYLEICDNIFQNVCRENNIFSSKNYLIDINIQSDSVYDVSKANAKEISSIPMHGVELENLTRSIGNVFKIYHKISTIPKIEVNHFEVIKFVNDSQKEYVNNVLRMGVIWGIFKTFPENKKTDDKVQSLNNKSYMIHPIFTPHFGISYRKKKNMKFDLSHIVIFCSGDSDKIKDTTKAITRDNPEVDSHQFSLIDLESRY